MNKTFKQRDIISFIRKYLLIGIAIGMLIGGSLGRDSYKIAFILALVVAIWSIYKYVYDNRKTKR